MAQSAHRNLLAKLHVHVLLLFMLMQLAHVAYCSMKENHSKQEAAEVRSTPAGMRTVKVVVDEEEVNFRKPHDLIHTMGLFEGDIRLTPEQASRLQDGSNMSGGETENMHNIHERAVVVDLFAMWPGGVVPYHMSSGLPHTHRAVIFDSMQEIAGRTCVRFVPRNGHRDYIQFTRGDGCYSYIGRVGGAQEVSIGDGCQYVGTVLHELLHALGRWHEHSRPDRDQHINIHEENIERGFEVQFFPVSSNFVTSNNIGYDFYSIMHYSAYAFSRNGRPTITPKDSRVLTNALGQRENFSNSDLEHIKRLYCDDTPDPTASWTRWSSWNQCSTTCGTGQQIRTRSCTRPQDTSCPSGPREDARSCNSGQACTGVWSRWGQWSLCFPLCGDNRRRERKRTCERGNECVGTSTQTQRCASTICNGSSGLGRWSEWSSCRSCYGYQFRFRRCLNFYLGCSPPYFGFRACTNSVSCSPRVGHDEGAGEREGQEAVEESQTQKSEEEITNAPRHAPLVSGTSRHTVSGVSITILGLCMPQLLFCITIY